MRFFLTNRPGNPVGRLVIYYRYRLDQSKTLVLDPAFRFQPEGPLGPSKIVDPARFLWHDIDWKGVKIAGQVIYEMHIGTFTAEATWSAAAHQFCPERLPANNGEPI